MKNKRNSNKAVLSTISKRRKDVYKRIVEEQQLVQSEWEKLSRSFLSFNSALKDKINSAILGKNINSHNWNYNSEQSQLDSIRRQSLKFAEIFNGNNYREAVEAMLDVFNEKMDAEKGI